jgi:glycine/D-amino acid oxidase-like deaminating enzyme
MFARGDGAVSAESLRESLLAAARDAGAQVWEATVDKVAQDTDGTVAVTSDLGTVRARNVVLANGSDIVRLAQQAGESIRVDSSPAIRYQFAAPKCLSRRILSGPDYEIRPSAPGVYLGAEDFIAHDGPEGPAGRVGGSINAIARAFGLDGPLRVTDIRVGFRPMPQRGQPYVGPLVSSPRILVACVHPGVTLAPAVARRVLDHVTGVRELHAIG